MKTELELVNIRVLNIGYARTQHRWGGTDISSPFARLYYVKNGKATLNLPDCQLDLVPGNMYLIPSFMPHSYICEPGFEFYYMFVYERYGDNTGFFDIYAFPFVVKGNEATDLMFANFCHLYPKLSLPYSSAEEFNAHPAYRDYAMRYASMERYEKMQLQGLVWILTSYFMKHAEKRVDNIDERLLKLSKYIKENISRDITLDELSDYICLNKAHLGRIFRHAFSISPIQYVIRCKVQYSQQLLLTTDMKISEVARRTGFKDTSYFVRTFKKAIGFTPQDYRDSLRY